MSEATHITRHFSPATRQGRPHVVKPWTDSDDDDLDDANDDDEVTALAVSSSNDIK